MNANSRSRSDLLNRINEVSFAVVELNLYLDTHPDDRNALSLFSQYSRQRLDLLHQYAEMYGPLTVDYADENSSEYWNWIQMPWPWQEGGC